MPKEQNLENSDLISESEYNDMPLDAAIKQSISNIQEGLNNVQQHLLHMIDHDEITVDEWEYGYAMGLELIDLSKELKDIMKSFKPAGARVGSKANPLNAETLGKI